MSQHQCHFIELLPTHLLKMGAFTENKNAQHFISLKRFCFKFNLMPFNFIETKQMLLLFKSCLLEFKKKTYYEDFIENQPKKLRGNRQRD